MLAIAPDRPENQAGGVRVEYNGPMSGIMVTGGLENADEGYSANMPFWYHTVSSAMKDKSAKINYAAVGLLTGKPDPMMNFPAKTSFMPYLVLRNATAKPLPVNVRVNYMSSGTPVSQPIPPLILAPFESRQVDFKLLLAALGLANFNGNLNLRISYIGRAGDLVTATGSVDQTGTYVFEVEPKGIGKSLSQISALWSTANGFDTMWNLLNPTNEAEDLMATFYYGDGSGSYKLPIHLAAHGSMMIDMAMLRMNMQPDVNGNIVPAAEQTGSAVFEGINGRKSWITVVIASGIYNVVTATCGQGCNTCCGYSNFLVSPANPFLPAGGTMPCSAQATYCDGVPDDYYLSGWLSGDTSIATVDNYGNVTGVAPGASDIEAQFQSVPVYTGQMCWNGYNPGCPAGEVNPTTTANVVQVQVTSVSLASDQVSVSLNGPNGSSGTLVVTWTGPSGNSDIANTTEGIGSYTFNPSLGNLATGQYTGVTAQWLEGNGSYNVNFDVLGSYLHTQYNTPAESQCSGSPATAYLTSGPTSCPWSTVSLISQFIS